VPDANPDRRAPNATVPPPQNAAAAAAALPLAGRTILGIFAHPDDESLACGGTLARLADAGARVVVICASRGEAGSCSDPALVPDGDLGLVRARELRDAAAVLGVAEVVVLDHCDGDLRWIDVPELHAEIVMLIERYRPDAVITFGEDGLYWHLDHIGVHERTYTAVLSLGRAAPPLYYVTMPDGVMRQLVDAAHAKGGSPPNSSLWGIEADAFGAGARPPGFIVDVRDWVPRKLAALRCHRTQMGPNNPIALIDDDEARRCLGTELFRRAPIEAAGDPILEHLGQSKSC
jgi:LmbE family N-acetylglucosaminyl deacetylase